MNQLNFTVYKLWKMFDNPFNKSDDLINMLKDKILSPMYAT